MEKSLNTMQPGEKGVVASIRGQGRLRQRLIAMGVTPGAFLVVRKFAPLGDPMEINIRNYALSIRKKDAAQIIVDMQQGDPDS